MWQIEEFLDGRWLYVWRYRSKTLALQKANFYGHEYDRPFRVIKMVEY